MLSKRSGLSRTWRIILVLALSLALLAGSGLASAAPKEDKGSEHGQAGLGAKFSDAEDAPWAALYMEKMNLKGVVLGQPDGKFKPNDPVTHEQAVTMLLRVMGLEDQVKARVESQFSFGDAGKISDWAAPYVAEAVDRGLLSWGEDGQFKPNEPTTRLEVAVMLVKALGLADQAAQQTGTLPFTDGATIPQDKVGYVLVAAEKGLVLGSPNANGRGYSFQANKPVTRAEMTAFMDREDGAMGNLDQREVKGTVVSVATGDAPSITVTKNDGTQGTYEVAADARVFVEKQVGALADIKAGDQASLHLDQDGVAVFVDVRYVDHVGGTVTAVSATSISIVKKSGEELTYPVAADCKVVLMESEESGDEGQDGTTGTTPTTVTAPTIADVKVGDEVALEVTRGTVTKIEVKEIEEAEGTVTAVTAANGTTPASLTIATEEGATVTYSVANEVTVRFEAKEQAANFTDIVVGDQVQLKFQNRLVAEIQIKEREQQGQPATQTFSGTVKSLDAAAQTFVLTVAGSADAAATDHTVTTSASTTYTKAGVAATFADLAVDQSVTVTGTVSDGGTIAADTVEIQ